MIVDCTHYVRGTRQPHEALTLEQAAALERRGGSFVWLELHEPTSELMEEVSRHFGLHELAVEDAARAHQRPKVEGYDDFHFLVFRTARFDEAADEVRFGELDLFLGRGFVIAVRHGVTGELEPVRRRREGGAQLLKSGPAAVVWGILDAIIDDYRPVIEGLERDIETVEQTIFALGEDATERIHFLRQEVTDVYRALHPLLGPLDGVERGAFKEMDPGLLRYFRDINDHVRQLHEEVVAQREQLTSALDANVALVSVRQNEIAARQNETTKQLTMVATVFLPLTFITGFFGQNFGWLVRHTDTVWDFVILGLGAMALSIALLLVWFRRYA